MGKKVEMIGRRFGRWEVLREAEVRYKNGAICYHCRCDCGTERIVNGERLRNGDSTSCGCYNREIITKPDAVYKERLYHVWNSMKNRCRCAKDKAYKNYGGRGIRVCDEWMHDYKAFKEWAYSHGYTDGLWLDRIDNNRDYSPENCRWATTKEQARNKRTTVLVEYNGQTMCIADAAEDSGINVATIRRRMELGWPKEKLFAPVECKYSHGDAISRGLMKHFWRG